MVQINRNLGNLNVNGLAKSKGTEVQKEPKITIGNNPGIPQPAITGGKGTKDNPYILDGKDSELDYQYLQQLADKYGQNIYFEEPGYTGYVYPD